ncbi:hypothetical protein O3V59_18330 [Brevibacillus thermoruber]|uniref:YqbQ/XkdQ domain-containing protein n=1 Tax=Brevibacillus thermoruber TaxID=33942 RepID=A0A9X3TTI7_9BACL|nr:hypothetical protein [Brevibacillus thermoruber]MDA5110321.1 hypothetical protein [Brevibacillus thermoruber]
MNVIYGKEAMRVDVTPAVLDVSWSSARGQIAQTCEVRLSDALAVSVGGFLLLQEETWPGSPPLFLGPVVRVSRDEAGGETRATAYELAWYLQKNECTRTRLNGDAGKELERLIRAAGVDFSCPAFGFTLRERIPSQSYASLYTDVLNRAYDRTGRRYFLQHQGQKLVVQEEGGNPQTPLFWPDHQTSSSTGESMEDVYTAVAVERYRGGDRLLARVEKEQAALISQYGRMLKVIDAGEDKELAALAGKQLAELSKVPRTRTVQVVHAEAKAAFVRAGWGIQLAERDGQTITPWIVTSCSARWRGGQYSMDLELERRG